MKHRSAKAKGSRLEKKVAAAYRKFGLFPNAKRMPGSGAFEGLKGDILKLDDRNVPVYDDYVDECKNAETLRLSTWWKQTLAQKGSARPVLHISKNHSPVYSIIKFEDFQDSIWTGEDLDEEWEHTQYMHEGNFNVATDMLVEHIVELKPGVPVVLLPKDYDNLLLMAMEHYMDFRLYERRVMEKLNGLPITEET